LLGCLTARAEAQVVRLATLYALWAKSSVIEINHLMAATAVWQYCEQSVAYIFGDVLGNPTADVILTALRGAGDAGLTRTEISGLFQRNVPANKISLALGELDRRGLAARAEQASGGRTIEIWRCR